MDAPWYVTLFGEDYLRAWQPMLKPERTEREVEGILALLDVPQGSRILDLCCGHGRIAVPLAQRGYRMTGYDLSPVFLHHASSAAQAAGVSVDWRLGDMRELPFHEEFDAVINIFTSFGYFDEEPDDRRVLDGIHGALRPGGLLLLDFINRDGVLRRYRPCSITRLDDGGMVLDEGQFDLVNGRHDTRVTLLEPDGTRREHRYSVRMYTAVELVRMVADAGLVVESLYGALDGSAFELDSRRLVVQARKPV